MRGKQGAASARRREAEALELVERVKAEKAEQKAKYEEEINRLREELAELRNGINARASRLAREEIEKALEAERAERQMRGLTDEIADALADRKDQLIFQTCHYLSIRNGVPPMQALRAVMTWISGQDYKGQFSEDWLVAEGLPRDGWVCTLYRANQYAERAVRKQGYPATITLERALEEGHEHIHPEYRREWWDDHSNMIRQARMRWARGRR